MQQPILDDDFIERVKVENWYFTKEFIILLCKIELGFFVLLALDRVRLINSLKSLKGLLDLIHPVDSEGGWTFIVLLVLSLANFFLMKERFRPSYWAIKIWGMASLIFIIAYEEFQIPCLLLLIYYLLNNVSSKFEIEGEMKYNYLFIAIMGFCIVYYLDVYIPILNY